MVTTFLVKVDQKVIQMGLSKKYKDMLISIEKCERMALKDKIISRLQEQKANIERPFNEKIKMLEGERQKALIDANLQYIDAGCGRKHPEIEEFDDATNVIIKKILRE